VPEGDTVRRTCDRLHAALAGRELTSAELRWPDLATKKLDGMTVTEVAAYGKHILIRLDSGWTLHSHLRMEGQWRITHTDDRSPDHVDRRWQDNLRARLTNAEWTALGLRLGELDLVRTAEEPTLIGHLGPDVLSSDFDFDSAVRNLTGSDTTIGAALLDQRNLAGIGTFWASESLYLERLLPWTDAADLPAAQVQGLVQRVRRLMLAALPHAVQSTTGSRRPGETNYVHGRSGLPCRRCGQTVRVAMIGPPTRERTMFYCPTCQGGLAPTDTGRPIAPLGSAPRRR